MGLLVSLIPSHFSLDLDCLLSDMVTGDSIWNLDLFRLWLPEEVIRRIEGIPPPHSATGVDRIIWGGTSTGSLFVKSTYGKLRESS